MLESQSGPTSSMKIAWVDKRMDRIDMSIVRVDRMTDIGPIKSGQSPSAMAFRPLQWKFIIS